MQTRYRLVIQQSSLEHASILLVDHVSQWLVECKSIPQYSAIVSSSR